MIFGFSSSFTYRPLMKEDSKSSQEKLSRDNVKRTPADTSGWKGNSLELFYKFKLKIFISFL